MKGNSEQQTISTATIQQNKISASYKHALKLCGAFTSPLELKQRMDDQSKPSIADESFQALTMEGITPSIVTLAFATK